jgi:DNA-binding transcriptional regulator YdaS (Cro superfamily)
METLRDYLNSLPVDDQAAFAARCNTTVGYLRKAISIRQPINAATAIAIERESGGAVTCESLRHDVDWAYIRGTRDVA